MPPLTADEAVVTTLLVEKFGIAPGAAARPEARLSELRLDSLALEELRLDIEQRLGVDLDEVELTSRDTLGTLLAAVRRAMAGAAQGGPAQDSTA